MMLLAPTGNRREIRPACHGDFLERLWRRNERLISSSHHPLRESIPHPSSTDRDEPPLITLGRRLHHPLCSPVIDQRHFGGGVDRRAMTA